jgi:phage baseplate assembly protein V
MNDEVKRYIHRLFEDQARKMRNIVSRGEVSLVSDGTRMQENQIRVLDGEILDGAERCQQYGFSSHPHPGAEGFVVFAGASRDHPLILAVDDRRYRVTASKPGEVVVYTDEGDTITLKRGNIIEVKTKHYVVEAEDDVAINTRNFSLQASESISLSSPLTGIHTDALAMSGYGGGQAAATLQGSLTASNDLAANNGAVSLRGHVHDGVQAGSETTDAPVGG